MVQCFLIHTICSTNALGPADSRVLYSRVFGPHENLSDSDIEMGEEHRRLKQEERLLVVARQSRSNISLSRVAAGRVLVEAAPGEEALALQEADSGVLRLPAGEPFSGERSVVWLGVQSLAFVLVCKPHENLLLAEATLRTLTRHCLEHLRLLGSGSEVLLKSDRIDILLSRLLPHGQLLFLNHRFAQSLEKEAATYMAK